MIHKDLCLEKTFEINLELDTNSETHTTSRLKEGCPKSNQTFDLENTISGHVHVSVNKHAERNVSRVKIKEESQDDGVQRWAVINTDFV